MEMKIMTPLTQIELNAMSGGELAQAWDWGEFVGTIGWVLGAGCGATGHPAVCGSAIAVNGFSFFFL
jgi:hypothetical protein